MRGLVRAQPESGFIPEGLIAQLDTWAKKEDAKGFAIQPIPFGMAAPVGRAAQIVRGSFMHPASYGAHHIG
jgi:hypothetical protein